MIPELLASLEEIIIKEDDEEYIKGENDTFHIEKQDTRWSLGSQMNSLSISDIMGQNGKNIADQLDGAADDRILDYNKIVKRLIPYDIEWPALKETPYFNHHSFYANLRNYQRERSSEAGVS